MKATCKNIYNLEILELVGGFKTDGKKTEADQGSSFYSPS